MERTTPTGALLLRTLAGHDGFAPPPEGAIICVGTGLGGKDTRKMPNVLRATLYETAAESGRFVHDSPFLLEANIDDMNPQDFALAMERVLETGALDVWVENILMKKGRPAFKFCCLAKPGDENRLAEAMMRETTTIGVRVTATRRLSLARRVETVRAEYGDVRFKSVSLDGGELRGAPEYDDLLAACRANGVTMYAARRAAERARRM
jgi:uncharacterized protein (DUF111 family)